MISGDLICIEKLRLAILVSLTISNSVKRIEKLKQKPMSKIYKNNDIVCESMCFYVTLPWYNITINLLETVVGLHVLKISVCI